MMKTWQERRTVEGIQSSFLQDILDRTLVKKGDIYAFLELHIEQGPLLEAEGVQLGVVSAIAAPAALRVRFEGGGGHAGALLMPFRCGVLHLFSVVPDCYWLVFDGLSWKTVTWWYIIAAFLMFELLMVELHSVPFSLHHNMSEGKAHVALPPGGGGGMAAKTYQICPLRLCKGFKPYRGNQHWSWCVARLQMTCQAYH